MRGPWPALLAAGLRELSPWETHTRDPGRGFWEGSASSWPCPAACVTLLERSPTLHGSSQARNTEPHFLSEPKLNKGAGLAARRYSLKNQTKHHSMASTCCFWSASRSVSSGKPCRRTWAERPDVRVLCLQSCCSPCPRSCRLPFLQGLTVPRHRPHSPPAGLLLPSAVGLLPWPPEETGLLGGLGERCGPGLHGA